MQRFMVKSPFLRSFVQARDLNYTVSEGVRVKIFLGQSYRQLQYDESKSIAANDRNLDASTIAKAEAERMMERLKQASSDLPGMAAVPLKSSQPSDLNFTVSEMASPEPVAAEYGQSHSQATDDKPVPLTANASNLRTSNMAIDLAGNGIKDQSRGGITMTQSDVRSLVSAPSVTFSESTFYSALSHLGIPAIKAALGELRE
jgi:hypothetical protein